MKRNYFIFSLLLSIMTFGQFTSPGTGVSYTLSSLSIAAPESLANNGTYYQMNKNITISNGDTLLIDENTTLKILLDTSLTIAGNYNTTADNFMIMSSGSNYLNNIVFKDTSNVVMKNTTIESLGGIVVYSNNFLMDNCILRYFNPSGMSGGPSSTLLLKGKMPIIKNSQFIQNKFTPVSAEQSIIFSNNYLYNNGTYLNDGGYIQASSGANDSIRIVNNTFIGTNSLKSGIKVSKNFRIEGNTIKNFANGIVVGSSSNGVIIDNTIENNTTPNYQIFDGNGIFVDNAAMIKIEGNKIRNNSKGIYLYGSNNSVIDLGGGSTGSKGQNIFYNNSVGGKIYALMNGIPNSVDAKNNCWREGELSTDAMVEEVIFHKIDYSPYGLVNYKPYLCAAPMASNENTLFKNNIYPNPSNGIFTFEAVQSGNIIITDFTGKLIYSGLVNKGKNTVSVKATSGVYILNYQSEGKKSSNKLIIK